MARYLLAALAILLQLAVALPHRGDVDGRGLDEFVAYGGVFLLSAVVWMLLVRSARIDRLDRFLLVLAILLRVVLFFPKPNLSDDFWRYTWDGGQVAAGHDPYASTPREVWNDLEDDRRDVLAEPWQNMNSTDYPSVYPPVAQGVFAAGASVQPGSWRATVSALKLVFLFADLLAIFLLHALSGAWKLDRRAPWLYGLFPLVVYEHGAAAHLEGLVPAGLLLGLWALHRGGWLGAGLGFGLAAAAKLQPLVLAPLLVQRLGLRGLAVALVVAAVVVLPFGLLTDAAGLGHLLEGLGLYVHTFAFNDSVHALLRPSYAELAGRITMGTAAVGIGLLALLDKRRTLASFPDIAVLALGVWWLGATTIHPWYLTPMLALAALTRWRWPWLWGALIPLTYAAYWTEDLHPPAMLVAAEYALVLSLFGVELLSRAAAARDPWTWPLVGSTWRGTRDARLAAKRPLVLPGLEGASTVLDVGSGTGWLAASLAAEGYEVRCLDVTDRHQPEGLAPELYEGDLPAANGSFDVVLLATVLHHADDADALLAEALRVGRRVLVIEDVPVSATGTGLTALVDRVVNLDFVGPWPRFRDQSGWERTFEAQGAVVVARREARVMGLFRQVAWDLTPSVR